MENFLLFKQKTAYELRISDWSSYVCSSDLDQLEARWANRQAAQRSSQHSPRQDQFRQRRPFISPRKLTNGRSEEHTSELQSLMRISYAVFCLKKKNKKLQKKPQN